MSRAPELPSRARALEMLREQRAEVHALLERLPPRDRIRAGLGGGEWSAKDLVIHRWRTPAAPRARSPLGGRIGQLLAGSRGPFTHDLAHLKDLGAWVEDRARGR